MTNFFTKKRALISFFIMVSIQMLCYNYIEYIQMEPRSVHSWRQADCLSFVLNFYNDRTTFLEPGVNNLGNTGDGKIASDFPIVQYAVAQVWKITGQSTMIYRLVDLGFLLLGLLSIYKLYCYWFKDKYWLALLLTGIVYTSTILAYYGPTSLSDIQALGLSCAAFYHFIKWLDNKENRYLYSTLFLFTFAGLLKMSSAFIFAIAIAYFVVRVLFGSQEDKKGLWSYSNVLFLFTPFLPWIAWYSHVHFYNELHHNEFFLIGILPIWEMTFEDATYNTFCLVGDLSSFFLSTSILFLLLVSVLAFLVLKFKSFFTEFYLRVLLPILALICYILLFYQVFNVHDYYLLNMIPILVIVLGLLIKYALEKYMSAFNHVFLPFTLFLVLVFLTHQTAVITRGRIEMGNWGFLSMVISKEKKAYFEWNTWYDRSRYEILENIQEETLDSIGLTKDQKVLCLGDYTINRSLYLINRLGYTDFAQDLGNIDKFLALYKDKRINYLIVIDWDKVSKDKLEPYLKNKVYEKQGTSIYKL